MVYFWAILGIPEDIPALGSLLDYIRVIGQSVGTAVVRDAVAPAGKSRGGIVPEDRQHVLQIGDVSGIDRLDQKAVAAIGVELWHFGQFVRRGDKVCRPLFCRHIEFVLIRRVVDFNAQIDAIFLLHEAFKGLHVRFGVSPQQVMRSTSWDAFAETIEVLRNIKTAAATISILAISVLLSIPSELIGPRGKGSWKRLPLSLKRSLLNQTRPVFSLSDASARG